MDRQEFQGAQKKNLPGSPWYGPGIVLLIMFVLQILYFVTVYYLLTSDNPFNFNNNYHLIAFATVWVVFINITLFFVVGQRNAAGRLHVASVGDAFQWNTFFICHLAMVVLIVFPLTLYFLILDDFVFQSRQLVPLLMVVLLLASVFGKARRRLVQWEGLVVRMLYLVIVIVFIVAVMEVLTGLIPTAIRGSQGDVILPL
ncbi:hypothetical protein K8S19_10460 [bacterium]|nr:hypothetical protein [bacterium]